MSLPSQDDVRPVLLRVLAALGGRARPADIYPLVTQAFANLTEEDLTATLSDGRTNRWTNRIQWARQDLVLTGLFDSSVRGVWALTPLGENYAASDASDADLQTLVQAARRNKQKQAPKRADTSPAPEAAESLPTSDTDPVAADHPTPLPVRLIHSATEALVEELRLAATDSRDPDRLEHAVAATLQYLGFDAEQIGGAGHTDVLLDAPLGVNRFRVVVDAKSSARGRIADTQIDWLSIRSHREQAHADFACLVGPEFAGGNLVERAREFQVSLLTVGDLSEVLTIHESAPLTLVELRSLFDPGIPTKTALQTLRAASRERQRRGALLWHLLRYIDNYNRLQPDMVLAKPDVLLTSVFNEPKLLGTTIDDVRRALTLLETVGIVESRNGEGYVSLTSLGGASHLVRLITNAHGAIDDAAQRSTQFGEPLQTPRAGSGPP